MTTVVGLALAFRLRKSKELNCARTLEHFIFFESERTVDGGDDHYDDDDSTAVLRHLPGSLDWLTYKHTCTITPNLIRFNSIIL